MTSFSAEERQLLDESLQGFLSENYDFDRWRDLIATPGLGFGPKEWGRYAELGWLGVALPEEFGGTGGGITELAIVMAAAGRHIVLENLLGTIVLGGRAIELAGTDAQRLSLLPRIASGDLQLAFCHTEPDAGYARDFVQAVAYPDGEGYVIEGAKGFALGAHAADILVVSARIGSATGPVGLFLIPRGTEGAELNVAPSLDGRPGAALRLSGARVGRDALLGDAQQLKTMERAARAFARPDAASDIAKGLEALAA